MAWERGRREGREGAEGFDVDYALDGCGLVGGIVRIVVPLSGPGITIAMIFAITLSMQEVLYAIAYVSARDEQTVTVGLTTALIRGDVSTGAP